MKSNLSETSREVITEQFGEEGILLDERSVYIEGIKVLQKQERISYFLSLVISLVLIILLFIVLVLV